MKNKLEKTYKFLTLIISLALLFSSMTISPGLIAKKCNCELGNQDSNNYDLKEIENLIYNSQEFKETLFKMGMKYLDLLVNYTNILRLEKNENGTIVIVPIKNKMQSAFFILDDDKIIHSGIFDITSSKDGLYSKMNFKNSGQLFMGMLLRLQIYSLSPILIFKYLFKDYESSLTQNEICKIIGLLVLSSACSVCFVNETARVACFICGCCSSIGWFCDKYCPEK